MPARTFLLLVLFAASDLCIAERITLRLSFDAPATDQRAIALMEKFEPGIRHFANFQPHWNASLFRQGTELVAVARGNLDMTVTSAQQLAEFIPEFSIFTAGYVHRDATHQVAVFDAPLMDPFRQKAEDILGVKLLSVMYLGRRQLNLRTDQKILKPGDLSGIKLRMPNSSTWQFLGRALGASPTPMAFSEVYTALQTGAVDGQDNPLPTVVNSRFYEVTKQIILTSHIVDLNYIAFSKIVWDSLTAAQQGDVQKAADEAAEYGRRNQLALEESLMQFLRDEGLDIYEPDLDAFRDRVQSIYKQSEYARSWPRGLLAEINSL
ncbi:MAG: TRAP transporter substrate-binding protein DctP [Gammaproteobacteria bacterium]|mgnify:CR=1 FL=1|jgi:TRAP-type transport system periplasmic protein|nr:TRAP transporter substrate-binding protein DctP [Gammaproteobacteria bacterium]MBT4493169.1 TRAP transporter substrate-binding protein DctP [Gammaproteobacteria bacterium]MBT7371436.1 TRAP transporter substrate-binding protein DctP [Gammaproteobacteria bacterium]